MIPRTELHCQEQSWQQALSAMIRDPAELFKRLELDLSQLPASLRASQDFALRVTHSFVERMEKGNWQDPLLLQILPQGRELDWQPGFQLDPLEEAGHNPHPGLIHKYHGRVLLIVSAGCAVNCRYCFRRHFPYSDNNPGSKQWQPAIDYIANDPTIEEVIFSGGDPLIASDQTLSGLADAIAEIPHVRTLRIHSRLPVVLPARIDASLLGWLQQNRLQKVLVIHCNHANELNREVGEALTRLRQSGVTLLNQAVLLAGVNDHYAAQLRLSKALFHYGVLPYYLHLLDKVQGAAHFDVETAAAQQIIRDLRRQLPGYLVPKLVREEPGAPAKTPIPVI